MNSQDFPSKILLFGEYGNIYGSQFLTTPYPKFRGKLTLSHHFTEGGAAWDSNQELTWFFNYLAKRENKILDMYRLERDLEKGLYFDSNIPQGFGLGSSGALCAAFYREYRSQVGEWSLVRLREIFSDMESYFHHRSSGMDPLVCYIKRPLLFRSLSAISSVGLRTPLDESVVFFLINSGEVRKTDDLIEIFLKKYQSHSFKSFFEEVMAPLTNGCIELFLQGQYRALWEPFLELSSHQLDYLEPMIPSNIHSLWQDGLRKKDFALKLCGSGGGFFLGMTRKYRDIKQGLKEYEIQLINTYLGEML